MGKKIMAWWHRHPVVKTAVVTVVGGGVGAAAKVAVTGVVEPHALGVAFVGGAAAALYGLFVKRPQDGGGSE